MKVVIGKEGLKYIWQDKFEEEVQCHKCKGIARIMFVATEEMGDTNFISRIHENKGKGGYWIHDACSVAVYLCKECFTAVAIINQA